MRVADACCRCVLQMRVADACCRCSVLSGDVWLIDSWHTTHWFKCVVCHALIQVTQLITPISSIIHSHTPLIHTHTPTQHSQIHRKKKKTRRHGAVSCMLQVWSIEERRLALQAGGWGTHRCISSYDACWDWMPAPRPLKRLLQPTSRPLFVYAYIYMYVYICTYIYIYVYIYI